jgi:hypothetical protein
MAATMLGCGAKDKQVSVQVGDQAEGGTVFYVADDKSFALVAAPTDSPEPLVWSELRKVIPTPDAIGTGQANTNAILAAKTADTELYAAKYADQLTAGGYSDWYLPSVDELEQIYLQRDKISGLDEDGTYWSSSAIDGGYPNAGYTRQYVFKQSTLIKKTTDMNQQTAYQVRAVRTVEGK